MFRFHGIDKDIAVKQARHAREEPAECATSRECFENLRLGQVATQARSVLVALHVPNSGKEERLFRRRGASSASQGRHVSVQVLAARTEHSSAATTGLSAACRRFARFPGLENGSPSG